MEIAQHLGIGNCRLSYRRKPLIHFIHILRKAENPQFIQERRLFAIHRLFRLESKWNTSALIAGPKRNIFEMNRTTMRFTVPSSRLASFDWIFTSAFRPQFTTVPNAPKPAPRLNKDNSVNSILRTASLPPPGWEVWDSF